MMTRSCPLCLPFRILGLPGIASRAMCAALFAVGVLISGAALAQECPVKTPLTLKDTQDGFAGETGTVWTVSPDCSFTISQQIGSKLVNPHARGLLTAEQQARLREALTQAAVADLPAQLGGGPKVNARRITLSYEGKVSVLTLPPGGGDLNELYAKTSDRTIRKLLKIGVVLQHATSP